MTNENVRIRQIQKGVKAWQVADALGCAEATYSRKLRYELPEDEQKRIISVIDSIAIEHEVSTHDR